MSTVEIRAIKLHKIANNRGIAVVSVEVEPGVWVAVMSEPLAGHVCQSIKAEAINHKIAEHRAANEGDRLEVNVCKLRGWLSATGGMDEDRVFMMNGKDVQAILRDLEKLQTLEARKAAESGDGCISDRGHEFRGGPVCVHCKAPRPESRAAEIIEEKAARQRAAKPEAERLALDVSLEQARALHRVWRALNDGDCPKCHKHVAATAIVRELPGGLKGIGCPNDACRFWISDSDIERIERLFAPAMDGAVKIFEEWRNEF
jgi:hypothetical protein